MNCPWNEVPCLPKQIYNVDATIFDLCFIIHISISVPIEMIILRFRLIVAILINTALLVATWSIGSLYLLSLLAQILPVSMSVIFNHVFLWAAGVFYESLEFFCVLIYCASQRSRKYKRASTGTPSLFNVMMSWRFKSWIVCDQNGHGERHWGGNMLLGSAFENYINWCQYRDPIPRFHHCYTSFRVVSAFVFFFVFSVWSRWVVQIRAVWLFVPSKW